MRRATRVLGASLLAPVILACVLGPQRSRAGALDLAAVSCAKYENEVLASAEAESGADPIDTVMWLFGFSVARSGERSMYGDSLTAFGFALDAECKNNPASSLLAAVTTVKSKLNNPMDLSRLSCATFEARHVALRKSDPEGANTLTMWLFGYSIGLTEAHVLDAGSVGKFDAALDGRCTQHPEDTLYDALSALNTKDKKPSVHKPASGNHQEPL